MSSPKSAHLPRWLVAKTNWHFLAISFVALLIEFIFRRREGNFGLRGGPDMFWSVEWARDYTAGFTHRALIGEILQIAHLDPTDYLVITMGAWTSSLALYIALVAATWKLLCNLRTPVGILLFTAVMLSPATTGLIIETTGDPLQLILAVYFLLVWLFFRVPLSATVTITIFATFGVASVLVHEASIFFTVPCTLVLAAYKGTRLAYLTLLSHIVASAVALAFVVFAVQNWSMPSALHSIHFGAKTIADISTNQYLDSRFSEVLAEEIKRLFQSGVQGYFDWISILFGSLLLPVFFVHLLMLPDCPARHASALNRRVGTSFLLLVIVVTPTFLTPTFLSTHAVVRSVSYSTNFVLLPLFLIYLVGSNCLDRALTRRPCLSAVFLSIVILSTPLYLIAHDWGRFVSYSLFCAIVLYAQLSYEADKTELANSFATGTWPTIAVGLVVAGLTVSPELNEYRYKGLFASRAIFIATSLMIALALLDGYITDTRSTQKL
jgi:hypothetical protein